MKKILTLTALLLVCRLAAYTQEPDTVALKITEQEMKIETGTVAPEAFGSEFTEPETIVPDIIEPEIVVPEAAEVKAAVQEIMEPDFIGEVLVLYPDGTTVPLEKTTVQFTTKANASSYIVGIGKARTRITVPGTSAGVRLPCAEEFRFIVKAVDNDNDPLSIIDIFRFDVNRKERRAELSSTSTFGGRRSNNLDYLPFTAKKYGTSSYLIVVTEKPAGEYGITVRNPNNIDEKSTVVSLFALVE